MENLYPTPDKHEPSDKDRQTSSYEQDWTEQTDYDALVADTNDTHDIDDGLLGEGEEGAVASRPLPPNDLAIPPNMTELLDTALIPANNPLNSDTTMFHVDGHPELRVRLNEGYPMDKIIAAKESVDRLVAHGVNVLPSNLIPHGQDTYVVTKEVTGVRLDSILNTKTPDELVEQVDRTWAGLASGFAEALRTGRAVPGDVTDAFQYMHGTVDGDTEQKIWLVDLPISSTREGSNYGNELLDIANIVIDIERTMGRRLPNARNALRQATERIERIESLGPYGKAFGAAARLVVRSSVKVDPFEIEHQVIESGLDRNNP